MLVVAGAGSGKTRVITRRIAWLLSQDVPEWNILGVTFTNKAAQEMAERVSTLVPGSRVRLATFHSACAAFLRRSAPLLGFSHDFTIYDTNDRDRLLKSLMADHGISAKEVRPSFVGNVISRLKNDGTLVEDYSPRSWMPVERIVGQLYGPYQDALAENNAMDFDDLLLNFLRILDGVEEERLRYANRFRHILVDEFQDTNAIQYRIVRRLAEVHGNICVVGDPDQSIYSFRGAEIGNILSFPEDFPGTEVVKLETNYRSTATILAFSQKVISHNTERHEKELVPALGEGEPVLYLPCDSGRAEAREVAYQVRTRLDRGAAPSSIAVFFRAKHLSRALEEAFRRLSLPFHIVGDVGFFGRREVKDLCAFLKVCVNPRDRVALGRILNTPSRGIGKVSAETLDAVAAMQGTSVAELAMSGQAVPGLNGKAQAGFAEFGAILADGHALAAKSVAHALSLFLDRTSYLQHVCRTGVPQDMEREENVGELLVHAREHDRAVVERGRSESEPEHAVHTYLTEVSLLADMYNDNADEDATQLMTVHSAKGLEFDHVHVIGLEEGLFPHKRSIDDPHALEEERRLFYVASTRARRTLTLTRAQARESFDGAPRRGSPSRFLTESDLEAEPAATGLGGDFDDFGDGDYDDGEPVFLYGTGLAESGPEVATDFHVGEDVRHPTYGAGQVIRCFGTGRSTKVEVLFESGVRTLLVEYARLERGEGA